MGAMPLHQHHNHIDSCAGNGETLLLPTSTTMLDFRTSYLACTNVQLPRHAEALTAHLNAEAENLKGQVMVFMLVTSAKEWLETNELSAAQASFVSSFANIPQSHARMHMRQSFLLCC